MGKSILLAFLTISSAWSAEIRNARPNAFGLEFFGRNITYSVFYDRVIGPDWALGVGIGRIGLRDQSGNEINETATLLPIYANYYILRDTSSPFIAISGTVMLSGEAPLRKSNSPTLDFPDNALIPNFGLGYESRSDRGFMFRVTGYMLVGRSILPWVGGTIGYAF